MESARPSILCSTISNPVIGGPQSWASERPISIIAAVRPIFMGALLTRSKMWIRRWARLGLFGGAPGRDASGLHMVFDDVLATSDHGDTEGGNDIVGGNLDLSWTMRTHFAGDGHAGQDLEGAYSLLHRGAGVVLRRHGSRENVEDAPSRAFSGVSSEHDRFRSREHSLSRSADEVQGARHLERLHGESTLLCEGAERQRLGSDSGVHRDGEQLRPRGQVELPPKKGLLFAGWDAHQNWLRTEHQEHIGGVVTRTWALRAKWTIHRDTTGRQISPRSNFM